jgi:hypothetical protein
MPKTHLASWTILAVLCGCANEPAPSKMSTTTTAPATPEAVPASKLTAEQKAEAEAQKVCPVTGEDLKSMGGPYLVHVKDKDVFICCEGCLKPLVADPDKYIAKLQDGAAKEAAPAAGEEKKGAPSGT